MTHLILKRGRCPQCGRKSKAFIPPDQRSGFGPRFSAMIAEMAGNQGDSRSVIQNFCQSVSGENIGRRTIQKVIDRVSAATAPHDEAVGQDAREAPVALPRCNLIPAQRCSYLVVGDGQCDGSVLDNLCYRRNGQAFEDVSGDWQSLMDSDGYKAYQKPWV